MLTSLLSAKLRLMFVRIWLEYGKYHRGIELWSRETAENKLIACSARQLAFKGAFD